MLRDIQADYGKVKNTMFKAAVAMKTGCAVVKKYDDLTVNFPTATTAENLFFVTKERIPTGVNAAFADQSDYAPDFINVAANEMIGLEEYRKGERFATDQYVAAGLKAGITVAANNAGQLVKATAASIYMFTGEYLDGDHKLAVIEVLDTAKGNA